VVALSLLGLLVAGGAVGVLVLQNRLNGNIERIGDPFAELPTRPAVPSPAAGEAKAVNTLMVGSDSRTSAGDPAQWAAGAQPTDAIMLVHIPADLGNASLFSIPHDSWVDIPGHGQASDQAIVVGRAGAGLLTERTDPGQSTPHAVPGHRLVARFGS